jgi:hypothetical protein
MASYPLIGGYLHAVTSNTLPNTPAHEIVIHHALGDAQVSYQGAYALGRSVGASMFESNVHEPGEQLFGFPFVSDHATAHGALQVTWQFAGTPPAPQTDIPPSKDTDTHEKPRRTQASQDQMYRFFTTGDIIVSVCIPPRLLRFLFLLIAGHTMALFIELLWWSMSLKLFVMNFIINVSSHLILLFNSLSSSINVAIINCECF